MMPPDLSACHLIRISQSHSVVRPACNSSSHLTRGRCVNLAIMTKTVREQKSESLCTCSHVHEPDIQFYKQPLMEVDMPLISSFQYKLLFIHSFGHGNKKRYAISQGVKLKQRLVRLRAELFCLAVSAATNKMKYVKWHCSR